MLVSLLTTPFGQRGKRGHQLDGGTRNEIRSCRASFWFTIVRMRPLDGIHHYHAAGEGAQGGDGGAADDEIVAIHVSPMVGSTPGTLAL